jgi:Fe-S oxidoreductase
MTTVDGRHELDREAERLAYKPPEIRHDKQGDMGSDERINKAMHNFVKNFNTQTASYLDGCLHCGMCADACHFHVRTDDPRYTPIWKIELFKRTYKRQVGPFAFFYRLLGLKRQVTIEDLEEWQHLLYDSCTVCGRCAVRQLHRLRPLFARMPDGHRYRRARFDGQARHVQSRPGSTRTA